MLCNLSNESLAANNDATLWATQALGANRVTVLNHATSGDVSGHLGAVVGYGAAVIWEQKPDQ